VLLLLELLVVQRRSLPPLLLQLRSGAGRW
jgi:hypothetical protein